MTSHQREAVRKLAAMDAKHKAALIVGAQRQARHQRWEGRWGQQHEAIQELHATSEQLIQRLRHAAAGRAGGEGAQIFLVPDSEEGELLAHCLSAQHVSNASKQLASSLTREQLLQRQQHTASLLQHQRQSAAALEEHTAMERARGEALLNEELSLAAARHDAALAERLEAVRGAHRDEHNAALDSLRRAHAKASAVAEAERNAVAAAQREDQRQQHDLAVRSARRRPLRCALTLGPPCPSRPACARRFRFRFVGVPLWCAGYY